MIGIGRKDRCPENSLPVVLGASGGFDRSRMSCLVVEERDQCVHFFCRRHSLKASPVHSSRSMCGTVRPANPIKIN